MNSWIIKILGIIIIVVIVITGMVIYLNYVTSNVHHAVPIYLEVEKKENGLNENITIFARLETIEYPFDVYAKFPHGIEIIKIPYEKSPEEIIQNQSLFINITQKANYKGVIPFDINNSKKVFEYQWNKTIIGPPWLSHGYLTYKPLGGYYVVYPGTYCIKDSRNFPKFVITEKSTFHIDGIYAELKNDTIVIDYVGKIRQNFTGEIYIDTLPTGITFNYTGSRLIIPIKYNTSGWLTLKTSIGDYGVGYYNGSSQSS